MGPRTKHRLQALRAAAAAIVLACAASHSQALDKYGNFESAQERDEYVIATLRKLAMEMNSQTPIQLDEETRMMSVIALQKTITFNMRLPNHAHNQVDPQRLAAVARENLNHIACTSKATQRLINLGVRYVYLYNSREGKLITRVVIDSYRC